MAAGLVVFRPCGRVGQQVKGLLDPVEARRGVGGAVHVRVVLTAQPPPCLPDLGGGGIAGHAKHRVRIVAKRHVSG
jgi:hypothetical protein